MMTTIRSATILAGWSSLLIASAWAQDAGDRAATKSPATVVQRTYPISAAGIEGLRLAMREAILPIGQNRKAVATTQIEMTPEVSFDEAPGSCSIAGVTVDVRAVMTLPEWKEYRYGNARERVAWDSYVNALRQHEDLHVTIGEEYAGNMQEVLSALPTKETCDLMRAAVEREKAKVLARHRTAQLDLDARSVRSTTPVDRPIR